MFFEHGHQVIREAEHWLQDLESVGGAPKCTGLRGVFLAAMGDEETQI
jgi:hypothetical protein